MYTKFHTFIASFENCHFSHIFIFIVVLAEIELFFFIVTHTVLCSGSVTKTALVTQRWSQLLLSRTYTAPRPFQLLTPPCQ